MPNPLSGYKTYLAAGLVVLLVIAESLLGVDVPGFDPQGNWVEYVLGAFGLSGLRAAISKN